MAKTTAAEAVVSARLVAIADLTPNPRNARTHPPEQVEQIAGSIKEFGWTFPILADMDDGGVIVAGHGRRLAALKLIAADEPIRLPSGRVLPKGMVPVIDCTGWTEEQRRAYTLADNRLAETSEWNDELLKVELRFLEDEGFDLKLTGFDDASVAKLFAEPDESDELREWGGMPEFDQQDKKAFRSLALHFPDQAAVDKFAELIGQKITPKTRFVWYPEIEIETYADKRYAGEA